jgi:uncharacterized Zn finger protein (UPF0148 family)
MMRRTEDQQMKCPKCGWFGLRETDGGADCKVCGYKLSPGEADKFRLYRLLKEEAKRNK